jgi:predicted DNA-binding antitoxin AbrB/MazE fold protein
MKTIHAVYENGVFRPTDPVDLPEGAEVVIEPRRIEPELSSPSEPGDDRLDAIYEILSRSHATGETDLAARHNEHPP